MKGLGATQEEFDDEHVTAKDIEKIETALEDIADDKHINIHQSELHELKEEVIEYKEVSLSVTVNVLTTTIRTLNDVFDDEVSIDMKHHCVFHHSHYHTPIGCSTILLQSWVMLW